jgi:hypothetical protein
VIKRFLAVAVSVVALTVGAWFPAGTAMAGEDPPVGDDPNSNCAAGNCW